MAFSDRCHTPQFGADLTSSPCPFSRVEKGSNVHIVNGLAPLPWERGWGEAKNKRLNYRDAPKLP